MVDRQRRQEKEKVEDNDFRMLYRMQMLQWMRDLSSNSNRSGQTSSSTDSGFDAAWEIDLLCSHINCVDAKLDTIIAALKNNSNNNNENNK